MNLWPDGPGFEKRPDFLIKRLSDCCFFLDAAGAERRAGVNKPLEHDRQQIDLQFRTRLESNLQDAAVARGDCVVFLDVIAPDHIEDDINTPSVGDRFRHSDEILRAVIDGVVRAKRQTGRAFLVTACGDDHFCAKSLCQHDRRRADA